MESFLPRDPRLRTAAQDRILLVIQTLGELAPPAPGALISLSSLSEVCKLDDANLASVLVALEREGWLRRQEERHWELTLEGARAVEEYLPGKDQLRARGIRAQVLEAVCGSETAEHDVPIHYRQACAAVDAHGGEIRAAVRWLVAEGHLHWYHVGGYVSCTPAGKKAYRRKFTNAQAELQPAGVGFPRREE